MLQVASGRFHRAAAITKYVGFGNFYSNFAILRDVRTPMGTIHRSFGPGRLAGYTHEYIKHHAMPGESVLVWTGDQELNDDLASTMTMFLPGFFDVDQQVVLQATELDPAGHPRDERIPSNFLPAKLAPHIANCTAELERFELLLAKLVQLPRRQFEVLIECMRGFKRSILALKLDHLLAYSSLVFCLESLAQHLRPYEAVWDDMPDPNKACVEQSMSGLSSDRADRIKAAIVKDRQLRLTKRFVDFILEKIHTSYYTEEAVGIKSAIRPTELKECLKAAYSIRSGYAHSLTKTVEHIHIPMLADGETFTWEGRTVPTFRGLARLLEHVVQTIIEETPPVEPEDVHFTQFLPGTFRMKIAPKYALTDYKRYSPGWARRVLSLVASQVWHLPVAKEDDCNVVVVQDFVDDAMTKFGQMNSEEQQCILNIIRIYKHFMGDDMKSDWQALLNEHKEELRQAEWPNVVGVVLVGGDFDGSGDEVLAAVDELRRLAARKGGPDLPKDISLAASAVGVSMIYDTEPERAEELNQAVVLEAVGRPNAQELLRNLKSEYSLDVLQRVLLGGEVPQGVCQ